MALEVANRCKTVDRVSCEAADALCHDQIDIPGKSVGEHPFEALPVPGVEAGDAFVGIDASEHPVGVPADIVSVVIDLCLIRGQLLVAVGRYPRVTCDPALFSFVLYLRGLFSTIFSPSISQS